MDKGRLVNHPTHKEEAVEALAETMRKYPRLFGIALGVALQPIFSAILNCANR